MEKKIFYPNSSIYYSIIVFISITVTLPIIFTLAVIKKVSAGIFIPVFIPILFIGIIIFSLRSLQLAIDSHNISGPDGLVNNSLFGGRRKVVENTNIATREAEAFICKVNNNSTLIIRDKNSPKQIVLPLVLFNSTSIEEMKSLLQMNRIQIKPFEE